MEHTPTDFLKTATKTAEHFGFKSIEQLRRVPACRDCTVTLPHSINKNDLKLDPHGSLLLEAITTYCDEKLHALEAPVLLYNQHDVEDSNDIAVSFSIFNVQKSIAEAILIQATRGLLNDLGHTDHMVRINSVGDNESITRYGREIANFLKRRLDAMPADARELMKEHPLAALARLVEVGHELAYRSPNPMEYLSDQSRKHFREIVEYLDMSGTPYEIDPKMLGNHEYYSDALFSIDVIPQDETSSTSPFSIRGGRYDEFVYRKTKTRTPASGAVVILKDAKLPGRIPRPKDATPSVYVVQLGFGPKVRSLMLIDTLRQAGIPVFHDLASDSLSTQLRDAEARGVRYTVIVGQKEFVEGSVILRDMSARNQEHVPLDTLVKKLRRQVVIA
jgi:histidyl-tRNA synthetase